MRSSKNHSEAEIAAKLAQADDLAAQGKLQSEIAKALGVSVMTLHRWRKLPVKGPGESKTPAQQELSHGQRIADIQLENARLRRLVTDLLLEQMKLEETVQGFSSNQQSCASRASTARPAGFATRIGAVTAIGFSCGGYNGAVRCKKTAAQHARHRCRVQGATTDITRMVTPSSQAAREFRF